MAAKVRLALCTEALAYSSLIPSPTAALLELRPFVSRAFKGLLQRQPGRRVPTTTTVQPVSSTIVPGSTGRRLRRRRISTGPPTARRELQCFARLRNTSTTIRRYLAILRSTPHCRLTFRPPSRPHRRSLTLLFPLFSPFAPRSSPLFHSHHQTPTTLLQYYPPQQPQPSYGGGQQQQYQQQYQQPMQTQPVYVQPNQKSSGGGGAATGCCACLVSLGASWRNVRRSWPFSDLTSWTM